MEITGNAVSKAANQLKSEIQYIDKQVAHLEVILDNISSFWKGDDSQKFIETCKESLILAYDNLSDNVNKYSEFLSKVPGAYDTLDESYSKNINI